MKPGKLKFSLLSLIVLYACNEPQASFTVDPAECNPGDTVSFINTSIDASQFDWEFGDGNFSSEKNPIHVYESGAFYTVRLTATNKYGSDQARESVNVVDDRGTVTEFKVHGKGLEGNLLGDTPDRPVSVYLPPGYEENTGSRYPVVYLLHGYMADHNIWFGGRFLFIDVYKGLDVRELMDEKIKNGTISPMIIVAPNGNNKYDGCWYTNSSVAGKWEDFIVEDLVSYVDSHFRTLPKAESRGIAGHSMGGYGAMAIALKHPDVFTAVYALSGADLNFEELMSIWKNNFIIASQSDSYSDQDVNVMSIISRAVAYAPNPQSSSHFADFPYNTNGVLIDSIWARWLEHDPTGFIAGYQENPLGLSAIKFDCGLSDEGYSVSARFSDILSDAGIDHVFESYDGDHTNRVAERIDTRVLAFFNENLEFE